MNKKLTIIIIIGIIAIVAVESYRAYNEYLGRIITEQNNIKMQELKNKEIYSNRSRYR